MAQKSEVIYPSGTSELRQLSRARNSAPSRLRSLLEIGIVFSLILAAIWTPQGTWNAFFTITAAACVLGFALSGEWSALRLGLTRPLAGLGYILLAGAVLCGAIAVLSIPLRFAGAGNVLPLSRSWQYAVWSLVQEFILQGIFFVRLESILGERRAVLASATLFAIAHIPSPVLTLLSFVGGILFCELFRRWRNLYPLGLIHGALGLTIAASLPDRWLHHMRVGIGFLTLHR